MLGICSSTAGDTGLIPGQGTKILHAVWFDQKNNKSKQQLRKKKMNLCFWHLHFCPLCVHNAILYVYIFPG